MRILSIDPGSVRTGVALIKTTETGADIVGTWLVDGGPEGFMRWWEARPDYDVLVCEDYIVRQGVPSQHRAMLTIGFLKAKDPNLVLQAPSGRKMQVSDEVLKRLSLFHSQRDVKEALRHAVIYLKRQKYTPLLKAGWPR